MNPHQLSTDHVTRYLVVAPTIERAAGFARSLGFSRTEVTLCVDANLCRGYEVTIPVYVDEWPDGEAGAQLRLALSPYRNVLMRVQP